MIIDPDCVHVQEKQKGSHASFAFDLTYREFYVGVRERAEPGSTMICGSLGYAEFRVPGSSGDTIPISLSS